MMHGCMVCTPHAGMIRPASSTRLMPLAATRLQILAAAQSLLGVALRLVSYLQYWHHPLSWLQVPPGVWRVHPTSADPLLLLHCHHGPAVTDNGRAWKTQAQRSRAQQNEPLGLGSTRGTKSRIVCLQGDATTCAATAPGAWDATAGGMVACVGAVGPLHAHVSSWLHARHPRLLYVCSTCVPVSHQASVCIAMMLAVCGCSPTAEMKTT